MAFNIKDLNYDKDSKERMPWEHYLELYGQTDPMEISKRLQIPIPGGEAGVYPESF